MSRWLWPAERFIRVRDALEQITTGTAHAS